MHDYCDFFYDKNAYEWKYETRQMDMYHMNLKYPGKIKVWHYSFVYLV